MLRISRRYSHFVFGVIQSGLTAAIATAIASLPQLAEAAFLGHWLRSWLISWIMMLPVVMLAAPGIRKLVNVLTFDEHGPSRPIPHRRG